MRAKKATVCGVTGCGRSDYMKNGLCNKHYQREYNNIRFDKSVRDRRPAIIDGNVARLQLGIDARQGYATVDSDMAWLDKYNWCLAKNGYPVARIDSKLVCLHKIIAGYVPKGMCVDHANRNRLDNRKENIRIATYSQNSANVKPMSACGYRGVSKFGNRWSAKLCGKRIGAFDYPEEAAKAYDKAAKERWGEFAYQNFPTA